MEGLATFLRVHEKIRKEKLSFLRVLKLFMGIAAGPEEL